jgi:predicted nuclease of restriction endonuclease-like RecB superfamily
MNLDDYISQEKPISEKVIILPKNLLNFRKFGKIIKPEFIDEKDDDLKKCYDLWKSSEGLKIKEIKDKISEIEDFSNYKKVRGIVHILSQISQLTKSEENAKEIRKFIFLRGPALTEEEKERIIKEAEIEFQTKISEDKIWGDINPYKVLLKAPEISIQDISKIYNLSLACGIALLSHKINFKVSENIGDIIRFAKKLGLMYDSAKEGWISVFGPATLIKESTKYSLSLSILVSKIVRKKSFEIEIETEKGILKLNQEHKKFFPEIDEDVKFDSSYEEQVSRIIQDAFTNLNLIREPEAIFFREGVFIPDFKLINDEGKEVLIEIAGFWTEDYIKKKIEKLKKFWESSQRKIIVLASEKLALSFGNIKLSDNVIVFKNELPSLELIKKIKEIIPDAKITKQKNQIQQIQIPDEIKEKIKEGMSITEAQKILQAHKLDLDPKKVVSLLGYKIEWQSIFDGILKKDK